MTAYALGLLIADAVGVIGLILWWFLWRADMRARNGK